MITIHPKLKIANIMLLLIQNDKRFENINAEIEVFNTFSNFHEQGYIITTKNKTIAFGGTYCDNCLDSVVVFNSNKVEDTRRNNYSDEFWNSEEIFGQYEYQDALNHIHELIK